jgi:Nitrite/Sulfite reductase ferredoxin-like half domain
VAHGHSRHWSTHSQGLKGGGGAGGQFIAPWVSFYANRYGDGSVRLTVEENIIFPNIPEAKLAAMQQVQALRGTGIYLARNNPIAHAEGHVPWIDPSIRNMVLTRDSPLE